MFLSFAYLAVRALLGLLVRSRRGPDLKDLELMVLRHELAVLRRQVGRPTLRPAERALLAAAACHLPRPVNSVRLVTPTTLLHRHRAILSVTQRPDREPDLVRLVVPSDSPIRRILLILDIPKLIPIHQSVPAALAAARVPASGAAVLVAPEVAPAQITPEKG